MKRLTVSYCTAVMNRTHHLKETLPRNLAEQKTPGVEFVIANYGSRDDLDSWMRDACREAIANGQIKYVRNRRPRYFHTARAKNMAHLAATGDIVCNLDADNFLGNGFTSYLRRVFNREPDSVVHATAAYSAHGRIAMLRHHFEEIGGYNESFEGWGNEDYELINRACALRHLTPHPCPSPAFARCLEHGDEERIQNFSPRIRSLGKDKTCWANGKRFVFSSAAWRRGLLIPRTFHLVILPEEGPGAWAPAWTSWQKWHPRWRLRVWTVDEVENVAGAAPAGLTGERLRWCLQCRILYRFGGVIVHPGLNCARPLEPLIRDATACIALHNGVEAFTVAAAFRRHSLCWEVLERPGFFHQADPETCFRDLAARHHWRELPAPCHNPKSVTTQGSESYFLSTGRPFRNRSMASQT
jgi:hypothetical protein